MPIRRGERAETILRAYLYAILAANGEPRYVGVTFEPAQRWASHEVRNADSGLCVLAGFMRHGDALLAERSLSACLRKAGYALVNSEGNALGVNRGVMADIETERRCASLKPRASAVVGRLGDTRPCEACGSDFVASRKAQRFCHSRCRMVYHGRAARP